MNRIRRAASLVWFLVLVFILTLLPQGVWTALLALNLKTGIGVPWAVPAALAVVWLGWRLAGGESPWPRSPTASARRRAHPIDAPAFTLALVANAFALLALIGVWIGLRALAPSGGNRLPDFSAYPPWIVALLLGCGAVVGAVSEEVGLRGYLQQRLEHLAPWPVAVVLMALIAAPAHAATQGFVWSTFLFYILADITYGVSAYLTNSILPGLVAHAVGLFVFFTVIWPRDGSWHMFSLNHPDPAFWGLVGAVASFAGLAIVSFVGLARLAARDPVNDPIGAMGG